MYVLYEKSSFLEIFNLSVAHVLVDGSKFEGGVEVASTLEEFVLELNPMKSQGVKEAFKDVHAHENTKSDCDEGEPDEEGLESD